MSLASRVAIFEKNTANNGKGFGNRDGGSFQKTAASKSPHTPKTLVKTTPSNKAKAKQTPIVNAFKTSVPATGSNRVSTSSIKPSDGTAPTKSASKASAPTCFTEQAPKTTQKKAPVGAVQAKGSSKANAPKWFTEPAPATSSNKAPNSNVSKVHRTTKTVPPKAKTTSVHEASATTPTKSCSKIWPSQYLTKDKGLVDFSKLNEKYLMLYFSGQFCHICQSVTPKLSHAYNQLKAAYPNEFEIVYVSADQDEKTIKQAFASVPFAALPFNDQGAKQDLFQKFGVKQFPTFIVLGPVDKATGERPVINNNETCNLHSVRGAIDRGTIVQDFPFYPKRHDITLGTDGIQTNRSLLVFCEDGNYKEKTILIKAVEQVAERRKGSSSPKLFYATQAGGYTDAYRGVLKIQGMKNKGGPIVTLLDWPDNGGYYLSTPKYDEITADWIDKFLDNPGERLQMTA